MERDDTALVDAFLRSLAHLDDDGAPPPAKAVLRRAQLRAQLEAEQRRVDGAALPLVAATLLPPLLGVAAPWAIRAGGDSIVASAAVVTALAGALAVRLALIED